jgi:hypothetical protein
MLVASSPDEQLSPSEEGFCSMELVMSKIVHLKFQLEQIQLSLDKWQNCQNIIRA